MLKQIDYYLCFCLFPSLERKEQKKKSKTFSSVYFQGAYSNSSIMRHLHQHLDFKK